MALKSSLILEPTKFPRDSDELVYGKKAWTIENGLKKYADNYNPILEYWEQIQDGKVNASKKLKLQYKVLVKWCEEGCGEYFFDSKKANHIMEFAENYCRHSKGKMAGKKVRLELWEKALLASVYGFVNIEGLRMFQRVVLIIGKKNGKSFLDSIMGLYGLFADGEGGAEVYSVARMVATLNRVKSVKAKFNI